MCFIISNGLIINLNWGRLQIIKTTWKWIFCLVWAKVEPSKRNKDIFTWYLFYFRIVKGYKRHNVDTSYDNVEKCCI